MLATVYQNQLDDLARGYPIKFDYVDYYKHVVALLKSDTLTARECRTIMDHAIAHVETLVEHSTLEHVEVDVTDFGLFKNDISIPESIKRPKEIKYWAIPLNFTEIIDFRSKDFNVFSVLKKSKISGKNSGNAILTAETKNVGKKQITVNVTSHV